MIRYLAVCLLAFLCMQCTSPTKETSSGDTTHVEEDTPATDNVAEDSDVAQENPNLTAVSFEEIPTELQEFFGALADVEKLEPYLNTTVGAYIIEEGPGVYPVVTEVKTRDDFLLSSEFMLFMNTPRLANGYYINQDGIDPCELPAEGIFFSEASKEGHRLLDAYQSHLSAAGDTLSDELKSKLNTLDTSLIWHGAVNVPNKFDELNTFDIYLASIDGKICIAAIDSRGCGI